MKYKVEELKLFARSLLEAIGLDSDKSKAVGDILVEGDLLGHTTHGLGLLGPYLAELDSGKMNKEGLPEVVSDFPAAMTWDGRRLPGPKACSKDATGNRVNSSGLVLAPTLFSDPIRSFALWLRFMDVPMAARSS